MLRLDVSCVGTSFGTIEGILVLVPATINAINDSETGTLDDLLCDDWLHLRYPALPLGPQTSKSLCAPPYPETLHSWKQVSFVDLDAIYIIVLVDHKRVYASYHWYV